MKKILKIMVSTAFISIMMVLQSCDNFNRNAKLTWDSGPVENMSHGGTFKGYVAVYTIDWNDTKERSSDTYRVYLKDNGEYVIDYEDKTYILQEANDPIEDGVYARKWKIDYNHYIEDVPHSY